MTKMTTKTVLSLAFIATALSLAGCSMEYHDQRDQYMELSTPSAITTLPPMTSNPPLAKLQDSNADIGLVPMHEGMSPILEEPTVIESSPAPVTGPDVQILGQPGAGPALMNPAAETMPDMGPMMEDSDSNAR